MQKGRLWQTAQKVACIRKQRVSNVRFAFAMLRVVVPYTGPVSIVYLLWGRQSSELDQQRYRNASERKGLRREHRPLFVQLLTTKVMSSARWKKKYTGQKT